MFSVLGFRLVSGYTFHESMVVRRFGICPGSARRTLATAVCASAVQRVPVLRH